MFGQLVQYMSGTHTSSVNRLSASLSGEPCQPIVITMWSRQSYCECRCNFEKSTFFLPAASSIKMAQEMSSETRVQRDMSRTWMIGQACIPPFGLAPRLAQAPAVAIPSADGNGGCAIVGCAGGLPAASGLCFAVQRHCAESLPCRSS